MEREPTVFVVEDDAPLRQSMQRLFQSVRLATQLFSSGQEFLDTYEDNWPGCLVLDVRMPGMDGLELQDVLRTRQFQLPIIFLTGHGDVPMAVRAMRAGAFDFLEKPYNPQVLLERIQQALRRNAEQRQNQVNLAQLEARFRLLTAREREVLQLIVSGLSTKAMATQLGVSPKTIEGHRTKIMDKTGAQNAADLVRLALPFLNAKPSLT